MGEGLYDLASTLNSLATGCFFGFLLVICGLVVLRLILERSGAALLRAAGQCCGDWIWVESISVGSSPEPILEWHSIYSLVLSSGDCVGRAVRFGSLVPLCNSTTVDLRASTSASAAAISLSTFSLVHFLSEQRLCRHVQPSLKPVLWLRLK